MGFASRRFIPHIAVLILVLAVPTLLHSNGTFRANDCLDPQALFPPNPDPLWDSGFDEAKRRGAYNGATRDGGEWAEGSRLMSGGTRVNWIIVRTFDPKRAYHRPARNLIEGGQIGMIEIEHAEHAGMDIPIRWLRYERGVSMEHRRVAAGHVLVYDGRPIADPYWAQIFSAPAQLVRGRLPMTLYLAFARVEPQDVDRASEDVREWLTAAVARYPGACLGEGIPSPN